MTTNPYSVNSLQIPKLRGRKKIINQLERDLTKASHEHISIIGPKFIGKTVILQNIVEIFSKDDSHYTAVLYWDVRHQIPKTDQQFFAAFAEKLRKTIATFDRELSEFIESSEKEAQNSIKDAFGTLDESKRILIIFDGLDELLSSESITRNLWDSLREFASSSHLSFVTGSRQRLRDLCASPESQTSDFWNIFNPMPVTVGSFEEKDWEDFLAPFNENNITFDENAKTALKAWSGGVPVLATLIASSLFDANGPISKDFVDEVSRKIKNDCQDHLNDLWYDCTSEEKGYLFDIAKNSGVSRNNIPEAILDSLKIRGYIIKENNNKIKSSCRLMNEHALRQENISLLRQIFNSSETSERNIQAFIELKLSQIKGGNSELKSYIGKAVRDIVPEPTQALVWTRNIVNCAFNLIWDKELPDRKIPKEWFISWSNSNISRPREENIKGTDLANQCRILDLMTDTRVAGQTRVSRSSYLLINSLKSIGDFGQHLGTEKITTNFAVIACFTAIELCEKLEKELAN